MLWLSGADLLRLWEAGQDQRPLERALALLRGAPAARREEAARSRDETVCLDALDVATRDARLYRLRAALFGPGLSGLDACPECGAVAEFEFDTSALLSAESPPRVLSASNDGIDVRFRLPTSRDLAVVMDDGDGAALALLRRVVLSAQRAVEPLDPADLSASTLTLLERRMAEASPTAEVRLHLACGACGAGWERLLDIGEFLWEEICVEVRCLSHEVHALAHAYGWSEAEILGFSPRRRQLYLELA